MYICCGDYFIQEMGREAVNEGVNDRLKRGGELRV